MRILSLAQVDMSTTEAGVVHVLDLAEAMMRQGESVSVEVISEGTAIVEKPWLKVHVMPKWSRFWLIKGIVYNIFSIWILIRAAGSYDVAYVRYSPNLSLGVRLAKGKVPLWLEINGISRDEEVHVKRPLWHFGRIYAGRLMEALAYTSADKCICVTPKIAEYVVDSFGVAAEKTIVVANGVDVDSYRPMDKAACRASLGVEDGFVYIGFIGNFIAWQGVDNLIRALPAVFERHLNARALLVGDGECFEEYHALTESLGVLDKITFPGYVHKEKAPEWINCFDIGVVLKRPITSGYSPLKLYSYLACGIPVLATDTAGFEPVRESNSGYLVAFDDTEAIVEALDKLISDEALRRELGENARRCAVEDFSWDAAARKILESSGESTGE